LKVKYMCPVYHALGGKKYKLCIEKWQISTPQRAKTHELILMKFGMVSK